MQGAVSPTAPGGVVAPSNPQWIYDGFGVVSTTFQSNNGNPASTTSLTLSKTSLDGSNSWASLLTSTVIKVPFLLNISDPSGLQVQYNVSAVGVDGSGNPLLTVAAIMASPSMINFTNGNTYTFTFDPAFDSNAVTLTGTQTLTNKTLTAPTLTTPTLGAATATTINGNTFTTGTYVLTGAAGKTLTFSNTLTLAGTDGSTLNIGTGGTLGTGAYAAAFNPASPGAIGGTTPAAGTFTQVTLNSSGSSVAITTNFNAMYVGSGLLLGLSNPALVQSLSGDLALEPPIGSSVIFQWQTSTPLGKVYRGAATTGAVLALKYDSGTGAPATGFCAFGAVGASGSSVGWLTNDGETTGFAIARVGVAVGGPFVFKGYTVATLPTGVVGANAYVTDALAPTFLATVVGGGAITTPVFYNGSNWVGA
jgi:hypothetical protein